MMWSGVIVIAITAAALITGVRFEGVTSEVRAPRSPRPSQRGIAQLSALTGALSTTVSKSTPNRWHRPRGVGDEQVAAWAEAIAREIRGGRSLVNALGHSPADPALQRCLDPMILALERGHPLLDATERITTSTDGLDRTVAVIRAIATAGGGAAIGLDRTAASLRERCAVADERRSQSAQARLSAQVLTVLPGVAVVVMSMASPTLRSTLLGGVGMICIPLGALFNVVGWIWMRRILRGPA
jgi:Flp pilus assembly protein TadB